MKEIKNFSKIKSFLGIVIIAVAMFIFMPINVFATTDYEIYVNGEQFTSEKTTINCGDGTATFDISTNTLILNNATITKRYGWQYALINSEISNLTIQLIGNNVIDGNKGEYDGIGADGGSNVVIVGDGNLTMKDVYYGTYIGDYSVPGGNLKINNTTINIENAQATGIWVNHDLEIINSNIKIDKTGDDVYFGIVSNIGGTITIDGGNLDINTNSHCILLGNGDNSNHNVVIKSGNIKLNSRRNGAYGIKFEPVLNTDTINGNIKIDGGNLEISTIAGGTNIDDSKITINSKVKFLKGTSLKDKGKILLNEAKNYNITGTVTSFKDTNGDIMLHLIPEGFSEVAYETIVKGNTVDYFFSDAATGTYILKVMKENHVTREYTVVVGNSSVIQDVKICLLGDVNMDGKISILDAIMVQKVSLSSMSLDDYQIKLASVRGKSSLGVLDAILIQKYALGLIDKF